MTENIIHLVLARTPDAVPGTKGLSLFIVPRDTINADGTVGERYSNDVTTGSIEHKMGIKASATAVLNFGEEGKCYGELVGTEESIGIKQMFLMHPQELLAQTLNQMAARLELEKGDVDDAVIGCVTQVKEQGACIARNALIAAGWPEQVTGTTVNRFCGSGLQGINFAAMSDVDADGLFRTVIIDGEVPQAANPITFTPITLTINDLDSVILSADGFCGVFDDAVSSTGTPLTGTTAALRVGDDDIGNQLPAVDQLFNCEQLQEQLDSAAN